ncbi:geraniol dehydrogenase [Diplogelasinospora grovesii]|uniref:Geraniol dehydrogenase n=1 Tax=Diplogelasinospora grovesii TaxID=303347 RepID=A0AAN6S168_9PEZI|nr:geraniol dehydrogenase [Diplogelasinospora grovesii]
MASTEFIPSFTSEAYVVHTAGAPITLEPIDYGALAPDEIVVSTSAVSVCASDLKAAAGNFYAYKPPVILGHESAGTVEQVGPNVHNLSPGDKVVLSYSSCHSCNNCLSGANPYCTSIAALNLTGEREDGSWAARSPTTGNPVRGHFFGQSSMGRRIVARANCAVRLPRDTPETELRMFAALGCGIQTGAGAIFNVANPKPNSSILIFGAGSVGLAAVLAAHLASPAALVIVDNSPQKLVSLPECITTALTGSVDSSTLSEEHLVERLKALTPGNLGFDYVLDCVGRGELVRIGHRSLKPRGMVITVGGSADVALQVTMGEHLTKGATYRGTHQGDSVPSISIPLLIDLWRRGRFPFDQFLTEYEFDQLDKALADLKEGKAVKPVLVNN